VELIKPDDQDKRDDDDIAQALGAQPAEAPQSAAKAKKDSSGQTWLRVLGLILLAAVVVALLVLFARWIYHTTHKNNSNQVTTNTPAQTPLSTNSSGQSGNISVPNNQNKSTTAGGSSSSTNNNNSSSQPTSSSPNAVHPNNSSNLPNNGPGDVARIFIGASLAAAGLHYIVSLRRSIRS
jgi:cytoskeletal protein RodZ